MDLQNICQVNSVTLDKANIKYLDKQGLDNEEYEIVINPDYIEVYSSTDCGFYYASKTLKQLLVEKVVECGYIKDKPDLKVRGFMHDISRNKVPKLETLKYIVDIMSDSKLNPSTYNSK